MQDRESSLLELEFLSKSLPERGCHAGLSHPIVRDEPSMELDTQIAYLSRDCRHIFTHIRSQQIVFDDDMETVEMPAEDLLFFVVSIFEEMELVDESIFQRGSECFWSRRRTDERERM